MPDLTPPFPSYPSLQLNPPPNDGRKRAPCGASVGDSKAVALQGAAGPRNVGESPICRRRRRRRRAPRARAASTPPSECRHVPLIAESVFECQT